MTDSPSGSTAAPISVAVVSWNTRDLLDACLRSLYPDVQAGRSEVWVVDNASSDGSPELVRERHPWVRLIASERNLGFGAAVNAAASRSRSPWLGIANADVRVGPGALEALLAAARADPPAGAFAPRLILPDGSTQHSVFHFPTVPFAAVFNSGLWRAIPTLGDELMLEGHWDTERARRVDWAVGAFLLVRRSAWEATGGFDPAMWMYAEDLDLAWRLARAGWPTRYVPGAVVHHVSAASTTQAWGDGRTERWQRSTYAWMLRRRGGPRARSVAALNVAGAAARWSLAAPAAVVAPRRYRARRDACRWWVGVHRSGLGPRADLESHA